MAVDDEPDGLAALCLILKLNGAEVCGLLSAAEALAAFNSFCPQVLISDLNMPELDGFALISKVRELAEVLPGELGTVAFSAYGSPENKARAFAAGYQRFLVKPAGPAEIVKTVVAALPH
jgi:CheY-like chemotaxis protein